MLFLNYLKPAGLITSEQIEKRYKKMPYKFSKKKRIMVVDDDKDIRDFLSEALYEYGYDVIVAACGNEGWGLFRKSIVDLVITDCQMPEIDGWQLAELIKRRSPRTPVIMITGQAKDAVKNNYQQAYIDFLIHKPFNLDNLYKTVQGFLCHHLLDKYGLKTNAYHTC